METLGLQIEHAIREIHEQYNDLQEQLGTSRGYSLEIERLKHQAIDTYMAAVAEVFKYATREK